MLCKTASFIIDNPAKFKLQVLAWADHHFDTVCCLDNNHYNNYSYHTYESLIAVGARDTLRLKCGNAFRSLRKFHENKKDWLFGFLGYDLKNEIENLRSDNPDGLRFPDLFFFQPELVVEIYANHAVASSTPFPKKRGAQAESVLLSAINSSTMKAALNAGIFSLGERQEGMRVTPLHPRIPKTQYLQTVKNIQEHIQKGDIYEMNLCQEFFAEHARINPLSTFLQLNELSKAPFACYLKFEDKYLLSASPERFLKKQGNRIISMPVKGTARRGTNPKEDESVRENFFRDPKERSENVMIVDLVRNDLSKSCIHGSVKVEELFGIKTFPHVHQMVSTITGTLRDDVHFIDAIRNAFPMGSMTGAPKVRAMQLIERHEKSKRGLYSGAAGYITPDGDFDFNVVIRSLLYNSANQYLSFHVGSAIVADSIPEREYDECLLKAKALKSVLESPAIPSANVGAGSQMLLI